MKIKFCRICQKETNFDNSHGCYVCRNRKTKATRIMRLSKGLCRSEGCPELKINSHIYCLKHFQRNKELDHKRKNRKKEIGLCISGACSNPLKTTRYCTIHLEQQAEWHKAEIIRRKEKILKHYGKKCTCCEETIFEFLTIDHINNDGAKHRKLMIKNHEGHNIYAWIIKNNYPSTFQILCMNCNWSKGKYGYCPHQKSSNYNIIRETLNGVNY